MWRPTLPLFTKTFPAWLLRFAAQMTPGTAIKDIVKLSDGLYAEARGIWEDKKARYARGDKSVVTEDGEGKDIMTILSTHFLRKMNPF